MPPSWSYGHTVPQGTRRYHLIFGKYVPISNVRVLVLRKKARADTGETVNFCPGIY